MAIEKGVFEQTLDQLSIRYQRKFSPFVKAAWYKFLNPHLSTEEFICAVDYAIKTSQINMPTPREVLLIADFLKNDAIYN